MIKKYLIIQLSLMVSLAIAQNQDETTREFESSCTIHIKAAVYQPASTDQTGRARVYITLSTKEGRPIPFQEIQIVATEGAFSCEPTDIDDTIAREKSIQSCNATDSSGKITGLPFADPLQYQRHGHRFMRLWFDVGQGILHLSGHAPHGCISEETIGGKSALTV